jgi:hypothetical protein
VYLGAVDYELGVRFASDVGGTIQAIRFWKVSGESSAHVGRIWNATTGQQLASVTFKAETPSGWQQQALDQPVSITPNTLYLVSVNTTNFRFPAALNTFEAPLVNGHLRAVAGDNGRYGTPGQFPRDSYYNANYFRDIVFASSSATDLASQTLFNSSDAPANSYVAGTNYELGVRLFSDVAGQITALRFWKVAGETGPHIGRVWTAGGQLLATVTFANETASGWQEQRLPASLSIAPNTAYVVSVNTTDYRFPATVSAFSADVVRGNLHVPVYPNGLYGSDLVSLPMSTNAGTNYYRDVVFVPSR